jgi:hypothetical protein
MMIFPPTQNANNLAFYAAYLPITVESNLRPITQSSPVIFQNCISLIPTSLDSRFGQIYDKCKAEVEETTTTTPTTTTTTPEPTTEEPEFGSGLELSESYILV